MAKIVSTRERVHQPFWDTLIRTAGTTPGTVGDTNTLFIGGNRSPSNTNLPNGSTLPADQSFVALALRVFVWIRNPILRVAGAGVGEVAQNGDYGTLTPFLAGGNAVGNAPASIQDYYRLIWQIEEGIHWTFGTGLKPSIENVPTWYLPAGGGISGDMGDSTDLIHWQNSGYDGHSGILRLARAVLIPPRQNVIVTANCYSLPADGQAQAFQLDQGSRNMLSVRDNLNVVDLMSKCITWTFDGLFSRDVQ
jgi:hypothetical protein